MSSAADVGSKIMFTMAFLPQNLFVNISTISSIFSRAPFDSDVVLTQSLVETVNRLAGVVFYNSLHMNFFHHQRYEYGNTVQLIVRIKVTTLMNLRK